MILIDLSLSRKQTSTTTRIATTCHFRPLRIFVCVGNKHPLQQGLRLPSLQHFLRSSILSETNIHYNKDCDAYLILYLQSGNTVGNKYPLQQGLRRFFLAFFFSGRSETNIHYNKDCDKRTFLSAPSWCRGRKQTSTTTRIATFIRFLSTVTFRMSETNIHYNKDCDHLWYFYNLF